MQRVQQAFTRELDRLGVVLRNDSFVVGELTVNQLGNKFDVAKAKLHLGRRQHDLERIIVVRKLA